MKARVLIAEDTEFMRTSLRNLFIKAGCDVVGEAENGSKAITMYNSLRPDIVTLDLLMPKVDGMAALKTIRAEYPDARAVMTALIGQQALVVEAMQAGAAEFLIKPFDIEAVTEILKKLRF